MVQNCPNCGSPNKEGHRFCSVCGSTLSQATASPSGTASEASPPSKFAVQSWDGRDAPERFVPAPSPYNESSRPSIPPPPPQPSTPYRQPGQTSIDARDITPVPGERRGDATYTPYTKSAVSSVEKEKGGTSWLMPVIVVASLVLVVLVGVTAFLLMSPRNSAAPSAGSDPGPGVVVSTPTGDLTQSSAEATRSAADRPTRLPIPPAAPCVLAANATPEDEVKHVVCVSNEEQIRSWRDLDTEILAGTRTGIFLQENRELVEDLKKHKMYGVPVNLQLDILDVKIDGDKATIKTYEEWTVTFYKLGDNSVVQRRGPDKYNETYHMVKQQGKWLIESVDFEQPTPPPGN